MARIVVRICRTCMNWFLPCCSSTDADGCEPARITRRVFPPTHRSGASLRLSLSHLPQFPSGRTSLATLTPADNWLNKSITYFLNVHRYTQTWGRDRVCEFSPCPPCLSTAARILLIRGCYSLRMLSPPQQPKRERHDQPEHGIPKRPEALCLNRHHVRRRSHYRYGEYAFLFAAPGPAPSFGRADKHSKNRQLIC